MSEYQFLLTYMAVGFLFAIAAGVTVVFAAKRDNIKDLEALLAGGTIGLVFGMVWPLTLTATLAGLIGLGAWYGWKSMRSIADES
jgi:hypothetical protein